MTLYAETEIAGPSTCIICGLPAGEAHYADCIIDGPPKIAVNSKRVPAIRASGWLAAYVAGYNKGLPT